MSAGLKPLTAGPDGSAPRHIAVIMDGNGRWAQSRGLPRAAGHRAGAHAVRRTIEAAVGALAGWGVRPGSRLAYAREPFASR